MVRDLDQILDQAIDQLRGGEQLDEILARYPQEAPELQPMLELAVVIEQDAATPLPAELEAWLVEGQHEFEQIARQMLPDTPSVRPQVSPAPTIFGSLFSAQRMLVVVATALVLFFGVSLVTNVSAQSLPGDRLYIVKRASEELRLALAFTPNRRSEVLLDIANERIDEIVELKAQGRTVDEQTLTSALEEFKANVGQAADEVSESSPDPEQDTTVNLNRLLNTAKEKLQAVTPVTPREQEAITQANAQVEEARHTIETAVSQPTGAAPGKIGSPTTGEPPAAQAPGGTGSSPLPGTPIPAPGGGVLPVPTSLPLPPTTGNSPSTPFTPAAPSNTLQPSAQPDASSTQPLPSPFTGSSPEPQPSTAVDAPSANTPVVPPTSQPAETPTDATSAEEPTPTTPAPQPTSRPQDDEGASPTATPVVPQNPTPTETNPEASPTGTETTVRPTRPTLEPTATETLTPTRTSEVSETTTREPTPTATDAVTPTETEEATPTRRPTQTPTATPSGEATETPTDDPTPTPTATVSGPVEARPSPDLEPDPDPDPSPDPKPSQDTSPEPLP